jgi:DNA-binding CsgD family transcriptional regulator
MALCYGRGRLDFSASDQDLANLIRPHALAALRLADQRAWITAAVTALDHLDDTCCGVMSLGPRRRVQVATATARAMLASYFPQPGCRHGDALPDELTAWLDGQRKPPAADGPARRQPCRVARRDRTLTVTFVPTAGNGALILTEQRRQGPPALLAETGLSTRETEVLWHAASGATSTKIARQLSISHRTVENHLSNIYRKLSVQSRTEAALRVFGTTPATSG